MSTQRPNENQIISSSDQNSTIRNDAAIISAAINSPQVISSSLTDEIILNGKKYNILKQIARSGEAEIFLINQNGTDSIFKYYYSQYKPKDEILNKLKGLKHPDIIALNDFGYYHDRFFEISEYAQGGTLQEIMPVTSVQKVKEIVTETIEALNYCHTHGIIHRDIKPENILYRTSDKKDIAIGDFGIASNVKEGEELVRTSLARTSLYAAPELFTNIQGKTTIEKSVDYYALGMTLLHLWFGRNPFEDVDEFGIMRLKSEGRVLFPDNIDDEVKNLIKGLITVNPRDRWAYNEVKRWIKGEDVKVHYQTIQIEYKPYSFGLIDGDQIVVNNPKDLAVYLEKYPEKGEGHLYRNTIAKWIEPIDQGLFNELMDIVERDYPRDKTAGMTKAIYILDSEKPFKVLNKIKLSTQEDIALHFEQHFEHYEKDLQNPNAAFYVFLEARNFKEKADEYRNYFKITNAEAALNTIIFKLQGADKFIIDNYAIYQPEELIKVDDTTKTKIINQLSNINSKLSLWICSFNNLQPTIDKWRVLKRFDETAFRYAMQQGFEFDGSIANDKLEFRKLFKNNFSKFFSGADININQSEANYWLKNYIGSSLQEFLIDYLLTQECNINEFEQMFSCIVENINNSTISNYNNLKQIFNDDILKDISLQKDQLNNRLNEIGKELELFYTNYYQKNDKYITELENERNTLLKQISSLENKINNEIISTNGLNSMPTDGFNIYQVVTKLIPIFKEKIINNHELFNKVIEITKGSIEKYWVKDYQTNSLRFLDCLISYLSFVENNISSYSEYFSQLTFQLDGRIAIDIRKDIDKIKGNENQIKSYRDDLRKVVDRLKNTHSKLPYLRRYEKEIEEINAQIKLINEKIVNEKKIKLKKFYSEYENILIKRKNDASRNFSLTGWDKEKYNWIKFIFAFGGLFVAIFASVIPAFDEGRTFEGILRIIFIIPIYTAVAMFIGWFFSLLADYIGQLNATKEGREDAVKAVVLTSEEKAAYAQSLQEIERFFSEKEDYEAFQETVRILTLDDQQFEKEFSKLNLAT